MLATPAENAAGDSAPALRYNRTFQLVLLGDFISVLGDGFHSVALSIWVLQTTGKATAMSAVLAVRILTGILLGSIGGTVADRSDRRRLMWGMDLLRGLLVLGVAWLVAAPGTTLLLVLLLTAALAAASQFRSPAASAALISIVGKQSIRQAGSLAQLLRTIAQVAGPMLGGVVVATLGGPTAMIGDAVSFFLCTALVLAAGTFPSPRRPGQEQVPFWQDLKAGFVVILRHPLAAAVTVLAPCLNLFGNAISVLLPVLAIRVWRAGPLQFGLTEAALPLGFAAGAGLLLMLSRRLRRRGWWIGGATVLIGPLLAVAGLMPNTMSALPFLLLMGGLLALSNVLVNTALQAEIAPEMQGRVFGTLGALVTVGGPLGVVAAGILTDVLQPPPMALACGIAISAVGLIGVSTLRGLREYN